MRIAKERRALYESAYRELMEEIAEELDASNDYDNAGESVEIAWKRITAASTTTTTTTATTKQ